MKEKPKAPGQPGRVEAIGQGRSKGGQFTPKLPAPIQDSAIQAIIERKQAALAHGQTFRPTKEEWDSLALEAAHMTEHGHSVPGAAYSE